MENWKKFYAYKTSVDQVGYKVTEHVEETYGHFLSAVEYAASLEEAIELLSKKYPYSQGFHV